MAERFDDATGTALGWRGDRLVAAFRFGGGSADLVARIEAGASVSG